MSGYLRGMPRATWSGSISFGLVNVPVKAYTAVRDHTIHFHQLDRKTGARALRSIVEEALLEVMYDIPERTDVRKCIITEETIRDRRAPLLLTKSDVDKGVDETNYEEWLAAQASA